MTWELHLQEMIKSMVRKSPLSCLRSCRSSPENTLLLLVSVRCSVCMSSFWTFRTSVFPVSPPHTITFLIRTLSVTLCRSLIGRSDTARPLVSMNGSLCFQTALSAAWTVIFFIKTQECVVSHCPTGFQANKQQTVKLFFHSVTRCSTSSHLRLSNVCVCVAAEDCKRLTAAMRGYFSAQWERNVAQMSRSEWQRVVV